jgi:hypothetical protein
MCEGLCCGGGHPGCDARDLLALSHPQRSERISISSVPITVLASAKGVRPIKKTLGSSQTPFAHSLPTMRGEYSCGWQRSRLRFARAYLVPHMTAREFAKRVTPSGGLHRLERFVKPVEVLGGRTHKQIRETSFPLYPRRHCHQRHRDHHQYCRECIHLRCHRGLQHTVDLDR